MDFKYYFTGEWDSCNRSLVSSKDEPYRGCQ